MLAGWGGQLVPEREAVVEEVQGFSLYIRNTWIREYLVMSLRIPGEVARLAIKDMESLERKLLRRSSEERIGSAEGGSLSVKAGRSLNMGESLSAGSWAKAERSVGLKDNRLSKLSSLRRGSRSSLSLTSSSRTASGT